MSNVYDADFILFVVQVSQRRGSCRGPDILCNNVEYYVAFSTYNWSQFLSISTNEISADFRLCRVMCIGKEGTPGGCKSQVPHLIDILLTMFYFNADHLNILCLLTSICFQLGESDLACCTL